MDRKTALEAFLASAYEKGFFTGVYLFAENGSVVASGAFGTRDAEQKLPLGMDSVFDIASITKQFTAAAIMLLQRWGLISYEDELTRFFPNNPYKGITIRHLLNHTSGLPDYEDYVCAYAARENCIPTNDIIEKYLCESGEKALFAPGEKWCYSNTGYSLLALIVERVSGVRFGEFLKTELFLPAGMNHTRVYHRRKDGDSIENYAYGFVLDGEKYVLPDTKDNTGFVVSLDGIEGDGSVNTTVGDLLSWDRAMREGTILTPEEQKLAYTPGKLSNGKDCGYGFGIFVSHDEKLGLIVEHSGGWPGYVSNYVRYIDADMVFVLVTNRLGGDSTARRLLADGITNIIHGKAPDKIATLDELIIKNADPAEFVPLCARYEGGYTFFMKDGKPYIRIAEDGEEAVEYKLFPTGKAKFGAWETCFEFDFSNGHLLFDGDEFGTLERGNFTEK